MTDPTSQEGVDLTKEHTLGKEVDVILRALHVHTHVINKYALRFHTQNRYGSTDTPKQHRNLSSGRSIKRKMEVLKEPI